MKNSKSAVMNRQLNILNLIRDKGEVSVEELSETFNISVITVRRDLQILEQHRLILRVHGGARVTGPGGAGGEDVENIRYCRSSISRYAARFVRDGDAIFVNGSRTALDMLKHVKDTNLLVYTNNAWALEETYPKGVKVVISGGECRNHIFVGDYVMRNLLSLKANKTFIGCAAVFEDGEFGYDIPTEIGINEIMISRTEGELYVLADHTKLKRTYDTTSLYGGCTYDRPLTLITDSRADREVVEALRSNKIKVIEVPV